MLTCPHCGKDLTKSLRDRILEVLEEGDETAGNLAVELGHPERPLRATLYLLRDDGLVRKTARGVGEGRCRQSLWTLVR